MQIHLVTNLDKEDISFSDAEVYRDIKDIQIKDINDLVIIHKYAETDIQAERELVDLVERQGIYHYMYLNNKPNLIMQLLIEELGGIVESSDFLEDIDSLQSLISQEYKQVPVNVEQQDIRVSESELDNKLKNQQALTIVDSFLSEIEDKGISLSNRELLQRTLKSMVENQTSVTTFLKDIKHKIYTLIKGMKNKVDTSHESNKAEDLDNIQDFGTYRDTTEFGSQFVVFKEYSGVRYLTSFVLGYKKYLEQEAHKRVRLIFVIPNQENYVFKYSNSPENIQHYKLEDEGYKDEDSITNKVGYMEKPINAMYKFFTTLNDDLILIVDRTHGESPCVSGKSIQWNCYAGKTEYDLYNGRIKGDKHKYALFSMKGVKDTDIVIPHIQGYPKIKEERQLAYSKIASKIYAKMDKETGIDEF